jgi:hypothetical protein
MGIPEMMEFLRTHDTIPSETILIVLGISNPDTEEGSATIGAIRQIIMLHLLRTDPEAWAKANPAKPPKPASNSVTYREPEFAR